MEEKGIEKVIKTLKSTPKLWIYSAVAILCVLLLLTLKTPKSRDEPEQENIPKSAASEVQDYRKELEARLEDILSEIRGAGEVSVMITLSGSEETVYAEDLSESDGKRSSETVIAGSQQALIRKKDNPKILGVLIVCTGGGRPQVKEKVVNAASTVLDIPTGKVYVTESK